MNQRDVSHLMMFTCWSYKSGTDLNLAYEGNMISGIINVYKEKGYTSFDVVAKLRGILKTKKIGHTGTLDPDAEGVLPVCLGKATKVCDLLTDKRKEYEAVMLLGMKTDTQDVTGTVLAKKDVTCSSEQVTEAVMSFVGEYMQVPPMYSALKVDGKKLCDLARAGVTVERAARPVTIHGIEILSVELPRVRMRVSCSKGTYIRTLCEDIGEKLGCGACMESLLRTRVGSFALSDALTLAEIEASVKSLTDGIPPEAWETVKFPFLHTVDSVFMQYEKAVVKKEFGKLLYNGNRMRQEMFSGYRREWEAQPIRVYDADGQFVGVYAYQNDRKDYKPLKVFM